MRPSLDLSDRGIIKMMQRALRLGAVEKLMAGNDTCCFTTEQYKVVYDRHLEETFPKTKHIPCQWPPGEAEWHLRSLPEVKEERPGLWRLAVTEDTQEGVSRR